MRAIARTRNGLLMCVGNFKKIARESEKEEEGRSNHV